MGKFPFNVRVYVLITDQARHRVIISDELIKGMSIVKFPGGGLEFGEGPAECASREVKEELGIEIGDFNHFYTTDFFIQSAFNPEHQIISIYYHAFAPDHILDENSLALHLARNQHTDAQESFRWCSIRNMQTADVTFPGDKIVVELMRQKWISGS